MTATGAEHARATILVVEDDPWTRTTEAALLAGEGYAVVEARNGEEGLRLAEQHHPDLVLLDLALPSTSGLSVLRELKDRASTHDVPVVIVSSYGDLLSEEDARETQGVLNKPFDYDALVAAVEAATGKNTVAVAY